MGTKRSATTDMLTGTSTVVEALPSHFAAPPLKLRIKHQTIIQKLTIDIYESKNAKEKLKYLLMFYRQLRLTQVTPEECEQLMRLFKELAKKESDHALRAKAVELMGEVCRIPGANKLLIVEEILDSLHKEGNHVVITQIFKTLSLTITLISLKADIVQKVLKASVKRLDDSHHDVRCACLLLVGRICPNEPIKISSGRVVDVMELYNEFSSDQDPRVRTVVYQSLLTLHQRNRALEMSVYGKVCDALNDDFESVRLAAVKLVWVFSNIFPERMIPHPYADDENIRLLDDAFIKICNMVNDSSMNVRAEAVGLLGSLHDVSFPVLEQTLDKKLMSKGKKTKSFNQRQLERFRGEDGGGGGQWSTGKTWGDNNPSQNELEKEEIKLMNTGSCGVFVRALEDEFMEVRTAGVDSLCELANQNAAFAYMSTDFLVDMFNDEIENVRLNSINSLIKIHQYVDLREDQLDTILECLNDFNQVVRDSVRDLLGHCTLSTQACLFATVLALLANLKKYPRDCESIWSCMKELGLRHPFFVSSLVPELLVTHPYYAIPEPNIDDAVHIAVTTLICNATVQLPSLRSLLPQYLSKHYDYLRDTLPQFVPELPHMQVTRRVSTSTGSGYTIVNDFFLATVKKIYSILDTNLPGVNKVLKTCISDLQHLKKMHRAFAPAAEFFSIFLQCQLLLRKCRTDRAWSIPAALATNECSSLQNDVKDLLKLSYKLEFMFSGLSTENLFTVKAIRILAHSLSVLLELRTASKLQQNRKIDLKLWEIFLQRLYKFKEHVNATSATFKNNQLADIVKLQESVEENLSAVSTLVTVLQQFFLTYPIDLKIENRLRQATVRVIEPKHNVDNPLRFSAGLILSVDVVASLENVQDLANVYIKLIYPDLKVHLHKPNLSDFKSINTLKRRLVCKVFLSHQTWTEPCHVKLTVVQAHPTDIKEELNSGNEYAVTGIDRIIRSAENFTTSHQGYLDLSETVKVYIQPKAIGR